MIHTLLGAPRAALVAGLVFETMWICALGGVAALTLSRGTLRLLGWLEPTILTAPFGVTFDPNGWRADSALFAQAFTLATFTALACGFLTSRRLTSHAQLVRAQSAGVLRGGLRSLQFLKPAGAAIALEVALALAITVPALLLTRSLGNLVRVADD